MIISPPFLAARLVAPATATAPSSTEDEHTWLARAMTQPRSRAPGTRTFEGSYPVSAALQWHNGLHLVAPHETAGALPVCAIADGKVIFVNQPAPLNADPAHPQNYMPKGPPAWTDNGCVIVEHTTDIGATGNTSTQIVYFSLYMHLSQIEATVKLDSLIYRKDPIGTAGQFHGAEHQLHFEICCDKANLDRLIGREALWTETEPPVTPTSDGRRDTVFGEVVIYLPASTPVSPKPPTSHIRTSSNSGTAGATLGTARWVGIRHDKGSAILRSIDLMGRPIGVADGRTDKDFEYDLYIEAGRRNTDYLHHSPPAIGPTVQITSSPSGWYELLRFGRNLGPDPLPADAAHWREIPTATGTVWADLNTIGSFKFSEADFLAVTGWNFFDDDETPLDMRCDSVDLKRWIRDPDPANAERMDRVQLGRRLGEPAVQQRLRRAICNFATEWDATNIEVILGWVRDPEHGYGLEQEQNWTRFITYCRAVTFTNLPDAYLKATWRLHPTEFIAVMRRCKWFSAYELAQCLPRRSYKYSSSPRVAHPVNIDWSTALQRAMTHQNSLNKILRKYGICTNERNAHFFGQVFIETDLVRTMREIGQGKTNRDGSWPAPATEFYNVFYGRGMMQLTWPANYEGYLLFRTASALKNSTNYVDQRISGNSQHFWANPKDGGIRHQWSPRYDPDIIASDSYNSCDSAGWYWISKLIGNKLTNINRVCDTGVHSSTIGRASVLVNGGGYGYFERQAYALYLIQKLGDESSITTEITSKISRNNMAADIIVNYSPQRP